ncbi:hypothetical protein MOBT1_001895 [Malassezia obtusa]|uniref:Uncharacterized protein n=1 Tax=Malassezia obtusa TaxID=76774 RepID=A0AAF0E0R6_9BASI|nr:hypothetical protein MOBT1_001895 [Malassezia obtusa]
MPPVASGWIRAHATPRGAGGTRRPPDEGSPQDTPHAARPDARTTPALPLRTRASHRPTPPRAAPPARDDTPRTPSASQPTTTPPSPSAHPLPPTPTFPWQQGWSEQLPRYRELAKMSPSRTSPTSPQCAARLQRKRDTFADVEHVWRHAMDTPPTNAKRRRRAAQPTLDAYLPRSAACGGGRACGGAAVAAAAVAVAAAVVAAVECAGRGE